MGSKKHLKNRKKNNAIRKIRVPIDTTTEITEPIDITTEITEPISVRKNHYASKQRKKYRKSGRPKQNISPLGNGIELKVTVEQTLNDSILGGVQQQIKKSNDSNLKGTQPKGVQHTLRKPAKENCMVTYKLTKKLIFQAFNKAMKNAYDSGSFAAMTESSQNGSFAAMGESSQNGSFAAAEETSQNDRSIIDVITINELSNNDVLTSPQVSATSQSDFSVKDSPISVSDHTQSPEARNDVSIIEVPVVNCSGQSNDDVSTTTQSKISVMDNPVSVNDHNQSSEEAMITLNHNEKRVQQDTETLTLNIEDSSTNSVLPTLHISDIIDTTSTEKSREKSTCEDMTKKYHNQSALISDDEDGAGNVNSEHTSSGQQEKPCVDKTKRKRSETDVDMFVNNPPKKRQSLQSIDDLIDLIDDSLVETASDHEDSASSLGNNKNLGKELETIDLDPDIANDSNTLSLLNNTIVLSDEEDTSDDIVVLGTPVIPSVPSYKAVPRRRGDDASLKSHIYNSPLVSLVNKPPILSNIPTVHLSESVITAVNSTQSIIARAISQLQKTVIISQGNKNMQGPQLLNNTRVQQPASAGVSTMSGSATGLSALPSPGSIYGSNIYNPCGTTVRTGLRPVIIDGSNVAMGHGNGSFFSTKGLQICINYFVKRGHKVFAFVPQYRRHGTFTRDPQLLEQLHKQNLVIFTPSRVVDGRSDVPYDDRYIVQTAAELGGVIVSTDNFRDLMQENDQWHDTIKNRLLMFTWVEDLLIFPQDPLGKRGTTLDKFLCF